MFSFMHKYLKRAVSLCVEHKHDDALKSKHCAILVMGGTVLSVGYNRHKIHGMIIKFRRNQHTCTIHAEMDAILKATQGITNNSKEGSLRGAKLFVARVRWKNLCAKKEEEDNTQESLPVIGNSQPCPMCACIIHTYGIKKVYFTLDNETEAYGVQVVRDPNVVFVEHG